ncbi:hypothetical protein GGTG_12900 [Gaeumannomyces tritici R3-111a-1]|uniref:GH16 domain-containing protein n=1 Tax=Gaeumannomyces tritici (strain R3-111a-1) TaxID=644352 RepID=J3PHC1_GAET3|nr:hypothetical protein GGTG_12900 [Gaeumannomyces tritici R3-111a-1]EJT69281.1 hypothetical protein GGTG_12900 [Gaeumannomyces tritici R3-111a-1]
MLVTMATFWGGFRTSEAAPSRAWPRIRLASVAALWLLLLLLGAPARADCECGYAARVGNDTEPQLFTDLLETDFSRVGDMSLVSTDWTRQAFNVTRERARGRHGEMFAVANARANPDRDPAARTGVGLNGGRAAGLELVVGSARVDGMVPVAEVDSARMDLLWGTYRVGMKLTGVPGTCAAFFWYHNDTQEIDMEFLTREFNASSGTFPVNLVLQSRAAVEAGYDAQATGNFRKVNLPFDPTADFHEYRIDFLEGRVVFYADGQVLAEMGGAAVPDRGGHLILQHWSNGNPLWSGGPPPRDAVLTVSYVRAYFNSSAPAPARQGDRAGRCADVGAPGAVCQIPSAPDVRNPVFFTAVGNMTNNQTVSGDPGPAGGQSGSPRVVSSVGLVVVVAASALAVLGL